ncbi:hypothetical protein [Staphylococcus epidermidis]|uniref:hypothetical protein n=1 Tax=Staphylococcus epidermidis TaxID=1282 RepID=UPI00136DBE21|nr:hypothetical protein [Staphylococcus epidermidis]NAM13536.1 hypothetical protein [Staphylococcus epidermidis]
MKIDWSQLIIALSGSSLATSIIVALVNHFFNKKTNEKKLNAEIISKARIQWINEVRKISAEFIYCCHECIVKKRQWKRVKDRKKQYKNNFKGLGKQPNQSQIDKYDSIINECIERYNECIKNAIQKKAELNLYFTPSINADETNKNDNNLSSDNVSIHEDINKKMQDLINNIEGYIKNKNKVSQQSNKNLKYNEIYREIQLLSKTIGSYLKEEWEKAKELK